jgi:hypothetical protein
MAESPAFRALFLKDPAGTASAMLLPADEQPPAAQIRRANRLLFALLSNAGFMEWAAGFQARLNEQVATVENVPEGERPKMAAATLDRAAVYREIVDAMAKHIDPEIMASLLMAASTGGGAGITSRPPDRQVPVVVLDAPFIVAYQISVDIVYIVSGATIGALSRVDLERAAAFLSEELPARAREVRASGALVDLEMLAAEAES